MNDPAALQDIQIKVLTDIELVKEFLSTQSLSARRMKEEMLYERYADRIFARCVNLVRNREVAKDPVA